MSHLLKARWHRPGYALLFTNHSVRSVRTSSGSSVTSTCFVFFLSVRVSFFILFPCRSVKESVFCAEYFSEVSWCFSHQFLSTRQIKRFTLSTESLSGPLLYILSHISVSRSKMAVHTCLHIRFLAKSSVHRYSQLRCCQSWGNFLVGSLQRLHVLKRPSWAFQFLSAEK